MHYSSSLLAVASATILSSGVVAGPVETRSKPGPNVGFDAKQAYKPGPNAVFPKVDYVNETALGDVDVSGAFEGIIPDDFDPQALEKRYISGEDDRRLFSSREFPWRAIGKLSWSNGVWCSATLVGPATILTAQHCMASDDDVEGTFFPGYDKEDGGERFGRAKVVRGVAADYRNKEGCTASGDWAIYTLDKKLGDEVGALGYSIPPVDLAGKKVMEHLGYPGDKGGDRPYRHEGTKIWEWKTLENEICDEWGPLWTDTDAQGGQSGGPIFYMKDKTPTVWGALGATVPMDDGLARAGWGSGEPMVKAITKLNKDPDAKF